MMHRRSVGHTRVGSRAGGGGCAQRAGAVPIAAALAWALAWSAVASGGAWDGAHAAAERWGSVVGGVEGVGGAWGAQAGSRASEPEVPAGSVLSGAPLRDLRAQADAAGRLLVVNLAPRQALAREAVELWSDPALAAWAARHGVVALVQDAAANKSFSVTGLLQGRGADPLLFRGGKLTRMLGQALPANRTRPRRPKDGRERAVALVVALEWLVRQTERTDPGWYGPRRAAHLAWRQARQWPSVTGGGGAGGGQVSAGGFLDGLDTARRAVQAKELSAAAQAQARLWEGSRGVAALRTARLTTLAAEMHSLAGTHEPARDLFERLYDSELTLTDWSDPAEVWSVMTLARVLERHVPLLTYLDSALSDADAQQRPARRGAPAEPGMMPAADAVILPRLLPRLHWEDPAAGLSGPLRQAQVVLRRLQRGRPERLSEADWARVVEFDRWLLGLEASRGIAAAVSRGARDDAQGLAGRAAEVLGERVRDEILVACLARGASAPWQRAWVEGLPEADRAAVRDRLPIVDPPHPFDPTAGAPAGP